MKEKQLVKKEIQLELQDMEEERKMQKKIQDLGLSTCVLSVCHKEVCDEEGESELEAFQRFCVRRFFNHPEVQDFC